MTINEQKMAHVNQLEQQAREIENSGSKRTIYGILSAICGVLVVFLWCTQDFITKSQGFLGLPSYSMTGSFYLFALCLIAGIILLYASAFTNTDNDNKRQAANIRKEAQKFRNMTDAQYESYLKRQQMISAGKAAYKLAKAILGG